MSLFVTRKLSFFPTTHASVVVAFATMEVEEGGPQGLLKEISHRYHAAYNSFRTLVEKKEIQLCEIYDYEIDNNQTLLFLPLKNSFRDGQINEHIVKALANLYRWIEQRIMIDPARATVTMPPILLEQLEGENRAAATDRTIRFMRRKLGALQTTIEVSVSPWRMMRKSEDCPLYFLSDLDLYLPHPELGVRDRLPENMLGSMERSFVTFDPRWKDEGCAALDLLPSEIQVLKRYRPQDVKFVLSMCDNGKDFSPT